MNAQEVINEINKVIGRFEGAEIVLLEELDSLAEGWRMRLQELEEPE